MQAVAVLGNFRRSLSLSIYSSNSSQLKTHISQVGSTTMLHRIITMGFKLISLVHREIKSIIIVLRNILNVQKTGWCEPHYSYV